MHPVQNRPITHREAARLQGFPDDFKFVGSKVEIAKQIGNAVPVALAQAVAAEVARSLDVAGAVRVTEVKDVYERLLGERVIEFGRAKEYA